MNNNPDRYALVVCNLPFDTPEDILKGSFVLPKQLSNDCKDLLSKMLITDPKKRITIAGIFAHPWVNHGMPIMERAPLLRTSTSDITIDPEILNTMSGAGFSANVVLASLRNNSFNQVTATYYFLEEKKLMMRMMIGQQFTPTIISSGANHHSQQQQQFPQSPQSTQAQNQVMQWNQQQGRSDKYNGYRTTLSADDSSSTTSSFTSAESSPSGLISSDSELLKSYRCKMCNYVDQEAAAADLRLAKNIQQLFSAMSQNPAAVQISKKRRADEPGELFLSSIII